MKTSVKNTVVLTVICLVVALALSAVNALTAPVIEESRRAKTEQALLRIMPSAAEGGFETLEADGLPASVTGVYRAAGGQGYVFEMTVNGFASGLTVLCGIGSDGRITGCETTQNNESPGYGQAASETAYTGQYTGLLPEELDGGVMPISGATKTSNAYRRAVDDAFAAYAILNEGGN